MTAIPPGIRPESARNPPERVPDSALNAGKGSEGQGISTSSRSVALGRDPELNEWSALARVITALRPDWRWADVRAALLADDRAYAAIARSAILGAGDHDVRHPNGLRYVNPRGNGPSDAERHPSAVTYAERMAELARITADTTGDRS